MTSPAPQPPRQHAGRQTFAVWAVAVATIVVYRFVALLPQFPGRGLLKFTVFLAWLVVIAISLYWIAVAIRWTMRKLFWRVGRRLLLSYVMIGLLPFILMTILLLAVGYMIAGVMSHAALRGERQATLGQMESWALEYGLTGRRPADSLTSLEIYDTAQRPGESLPAWLREKSFSGMVWRDGQPAMVTSRQFAEEDRTVVFVQPLD